MAEAVKWQPGPAHHRRHVGMDRLAAMFTDPAVNATARVEAAELLLGDRKRTPREARLAALERSRHHRATSARRTPRS